MSNRSEKGVCRDILEMTCIRESRGNDWMECSIGTFVINDGRIEAKVMHTALARMNAAFLEFYI